MNPMIIMANAEGQKAIQGLCDVALKVGGLQNLQAVTQILRAVKPLSQSEPTIESEPKIIPFNSAEEKS